MKTTEVQVFTPAELEAAQLFALKKQFITTDDDPRKGAEHVLALADRIRNERAVTAMNR